jgi:hypothetical protein
MIFFIIYNRKKISHHNMDLYKHNVQSLASRFKNIFTIVYVNCSFNSTNGSGNIYDNDLPTFDK